MQNDYLHIRISTELKDKIRKSAEKLGLDPSSFIRMVLTKEINGKGGE